MQLEPYSHLFVRLANSLAWLEITVAINIINDLFSLYRNEKPLPYVLYNFKSDFSLHQFYRVDCSRLLKYIFFRFVYIKKHVGRNVKPLNLIFFILLSMYTYR